MQVVGGFLGRMVAEQLDVDYVPLEEISFPDGEFKFRIQTEKIDRDVVLVLRKKMGEDINKYLVKLYFAAKTLHNADADTKLVMPYFAYGRQDAVFKTGEPLSSEYVAHLFDPLVSKFLTVTAHTHRQDSILPMFKHAKATNISGIPALAKALPKIENAFVLGPDTESIVWAKEMAKLIGADDYGNFDKVRDVDTGEIKVTMKDFDFEGKNLVLVDDMVSTGGTIERGVALASKYGTKDLHISFVHPVLSGNALERMFRLNPKTLISANTMESPVSVADVTPLIVKHL